MSKPRPYYDEEDAFLLPRPYFNDETLSVLRLMLAGLTDKQSALELGKPLRYINWRIQKAVRDADCENRVTLAYAIGRNKWF